MSVADNIRIYRKKAQKTQIKLAQELKISIATLRRWEAGETSPTLKMIKALAEHLGTSPENFVAVEKKETSAIKTSGMLIFEWDGKRVEIPPTEQGYKIFNEIVRKFLG